MKRATKKVIMMVDHNKEEPPDFLSLIPDNVLCVILSFLPIDEAVRTSILSKRWRYMWRYTSHLDLDVKHMIYPFTGLINSPNFHLDFILDLDREKGIYRYNILSFNILMQHLGNLTSCRFVHFPLNDVKASLPVVARQEKGLKDLTLECLPLDTMTKFCPITFFGCDYLSSLESLEVAGYYYLGLPSAFEPFANLRTLKLNRIQIGEGIISEIFKSCASLESFTLLRCAGFTKVKINNSRLKFLELNFVSVNFIKIIAPNLEVLELAYLICPAKNVVLETPNLRKFHCCSSPHIPTAYPVLKTRDLFERYASLLDSGRGNIFQNLSYMLIDLDLNNVIEAFSLSIILRACNRLQTLRIVNPGNRRGKLKIRRFAAGALPHPPRSTFWEGREICNCIRRKLKYVHVEGFTGKDLEVDFMKYLMMSSTKMKMITIVCNNSLNEANELLSVRRFPATLSIKLLLAKRVS